MYIVNYIQDCHGKSIIQQGKDLSPANWTYTYLGKKSVECYTWSIALLGAEIWTIRKVDQKYLESL
jgi:hypothetical protein